MLLELPECTVKSDSAGSLLIVAILNAETYLNVQVHTTNQDWLLGLHSLQRPRCRPYVSCKQFRGKQTFSPLQLVEHARLDQQQSAAIDRSHTTCILFDLKVSGNSRRG